MIHLFSLIPEKIKKCDVFLLPFIIISIFFIIIPTSLIFYFAFGLPGGATWNKNIEILNWNLFVCILNSLSVALWTTGICLIIGVPLSYFIFKFKNKIIKSIIIFLITVPLWSNYLIKLIGLKTVFDYFYGHENSTYGLIYTAIGLVYIFLPITVINIYNAFRNIASNVVLSSHDLGYNKLETFLKIIIPNIKPTLLSAVSLVFFPSLFSVGANDFLNNQMSSPMIGQKLMNLNNITGEYSKSMLFFLILSIVCLFVFCWTFIKLAVRVINHLKTYQ